MIAINDYVLIEHKLNGEKITSSGLIEAREDTIAETRGEVISVGDRIINENITVGSVVWFNKYDLKIEKDGKKIFAIKESSIVAVD